MPESMNTLSSISDRELRERLTAAVSAERMAAADVIYHLVELDRRRFSSFPSHATRPAAIARLRQL